VRRSHENTRSVFIIRNPQRRVNEWASLDPIAAAEDSESPPILAVKISRSKVEQPAPKHTRGRNGNFSLASTESKNETRSPRPCGTARVSGGIRPIPNSRSAQSAVGRSGDDIVSQIWRRANRQNPAVLQGEWGTVTCRLREIKLYPPPDVTKIERREEVAQGYLGGHLEYWTNFRRIRRNDVRVRGNLAAVMRIMSTMTRMLLPAFSTPSQRIHQYSLSFVLV
jgi:hypothetical protein